MMKYKLLLSAFIVGLGLSFVVPSLAADDAPPPAPGAPSSKKTEGTAAKPLKVRTQNAGGGDLASQLRKAKLNKTGSDKAMSKSTRDHLDALAEANDADAAEREHGKEVKEHKEKRDMHLAASKKHEEAAEGITPLLPIVPNIKTATEAKNLSSDIEDLLNKTDDGEAKSKLTAAKEKVDAIEQTFKSIEPEKSALVKLLKQASKLLIKAKKNADKEVDTATKDHAHALAKQVQASIKKTNAQKLAEEHAENMKKESTVAAGKREKEVKAEHTKETAAGKEYQEDQAKKDKEDEDNQAKLTETLDKLNEKLANLNSDKAKLVTKQKTTKKTQADLNKKIKSSVTKKPTADQQEKLDSYTKTLSELEPQIAAKEQAISEVEAEIEKASAEE